MTNQYRGTESNSKSQIAIVVMGAAVWKGRTLSGAARRRTHQAVMLFRNIKPKLIVFTGGIGKHPPAEAEVMASEAFKLGVAPERIIVEKESKNTFESILRVSRMLSEHGIKKCFVVTDSFHIFRCKVMFKDAGLWAEGFPVVGTKQKTPLFWWYWLHLREFLALIKYFLFQKPFGRYFI